MKKIFVLFIVALMLVASSTTAFCSSDELVVNEMGFNAQGVFFLLVSDFVGDPQIMGQNEWMGIDANNSIYYSIADNIEINGTKIVDVPEIVIMAHNKNVVDIGTNGHILNIQGIPADLFGPKSGDVITVNPGVKNYANKVTKKKFIFTYDGAAWSMAIEEPAAPAVQESVKEEAAAVSDAAPAASNQVATSNPKTGDSSTYLFILLALAGLAVLSAKAYRTHHAVK